MTTRDDGWSVPAVRERCEDLRAVLSDWPEVCALAEVESYWPGGSENQLAGRGRWLYCYAMLCALLRRSERLAATPAVADERKAAANSALREEPMFVELVDRDEHGRPRRFAIHPKSYDTLVHCLKRDKDLIALGRAYAMYAASSQHEHRETAGAILLEISYQHRALAWICHTPGARLPFDPFVEAAPELPAWTCDLHPKDFLEIQRAFQEVNGRRLAMVIAMIDALGQPSRESAGFEVVAAQAAKALGVSAPCLLRDWTLESWIAQLALGTPATAAPKPSGAAKGA